MTFEQREVLLHGYSMFTEVTLTHDEARWLWINHGETLLREWFDGDNPLLRGLPCKRPWIWWLIQVVKTGPRKQLKPGPKPLGPAIWFGTPARWDGVPPVGMFEAEEAYLLRHGLAGADELRLMAATGGADSPTRSY